MNALRQLGYPYPRPATRRLVSGRGRYVADLSFKRMVTAAFLRSPHAKATIRSIDTSEAARIPGVVAIFTGETLAGVCKGWDGKATTFEGFVAPTQHALARDVVAYAGEAVACVVAQHRAIAEDAVERIEVDWEPLDLARARTDSHAPCRKLLPVHRL